LRIVKGDKGTAGTMVAPAGEFKPRTSAKVRFEFAMNIYSEPAASATKTATDGTAPQAQSWRDTLSIHPAAALFPRMSSDTEVTAAPSESSATVAAGDDIGPNSAGEIARLNARIDELQAEKRQLEIKAVGLRSEIDELDGWVEDLYGELETILDRRNGIREQVARLKLEETQA
jgi:hypothetical protein